jgi:hypothetical protein
MSLALTHPDICHATAGAALLLEAYHVALEQPAAQKVCDSWG